MTKKIFLILFFSILILGVFFGKSFETDLLKAVLSNSSNDLIMLSNKFSSDINVIFEADSEENAEMLKEKFKSQIDSNLIKTIDFENLLDNYKTCPNNFLTTEKRNLLLNKDFEKVILSAEDDLYNPMTIMLLPLKDDPFLLFSDYVQGLQKHIPNYKNELNGKFYSVLNLKLNPDIALSPTLSSKTVKKIVNLKEKFPANSIYLTGSPIHSYFTSSRSIFEINLLATISTIFVLILTFFYFRTFRVLVPILVSIVCGIVCGYSLTAFIFRNVHVLTFVFSTTLIGICVDYSLHYFVEKDIEKLSKSLTASLFTTVTAFLILLFSNIPLLAQISVFTSTGLITVYSIVLIFYPCFNFEFDLKVKLPSLKLHDKKYIFIILLVIISIGLCKVHFTDDVKTMYKPSTVLSNAEKLYRNLDLSPQKTFLTIKGNSIEAILQTEEGFTDSVSDISILGLSSFIPSAKRQIENQKLIEDLYSNKLYEYAVFLPISVKMQLLKHNIKKPMDVNFEKYPYLKDFMLDDKTSVMVVNSQSIPAISNNNIKVYNPTEDVSNQFAKHRKTCLILSVFAFAILFVFLRYSFGLNAFKIILPSVLGILVAFSFLGFSNQPANLFHIFAMFLIMGFTLDYSIFRMSKIENSKEAVFISFLTTAFSFLLLSFTSFKLISSLGTVLFVGISTAYLFGLILIDDESDCENEVV